MQTEERRRRDRAYQAKHRGNKRSYVTEIENLQIILAWEAGQLSEGEAAKRIGVDRVSLRLLREGYLKNQKASGFCSECGQPVPTAVK